METLTKRIHFGVSYPVIGTLFILAGVFAIANPVGTMFALVMVMGAVAVLEIQSDSRSTGGAEG